MADALSQITTCLRPEAVQAVLDGAAIGAPQRAEGENPGVIECDQQKEKEVCVTTGQVLVEMHVTNWATAQKEDPELAEVLQWLESKKQMDLRTLLREHVSSEEGWMIWRNQQNFTTLQALSTYAPPQKGRMRICCSSLCQRCTGLLPSMGVIGTQDIKAATILFPYCKNVFGGQEWPSR